MAVYRRGKSWWYVFESRAERFKNRLASEIRRPHYVLRRNGRLIC